MEDLAGGLPPWLETVRVLASTLHMLIPALYILRTMAKAIWGYAPKIISAPFFELRPFYLPSVLVESLIRLTTGAWNWGDPIGLAVAIATWWWILRNEKDDVDRWKRRRKKLAEKVEAVGGKLTVVPVGSPA